MDYQQEEDDAGKAARRGHAVHNSIVIDKSVRPFSRTESEKPNE